MSSPGIHARVLMPGCSQLALFFPWRHVLRRRLRRRGRLCAAALPAGEEDREDAENDLVDERQRVEDEEIDEEKGADDEEESGGLELRGPAPERSDDTFGLISHPPILSQPFPDQLHRPRHVAATPVGEVVAELLLRRHSRRFRQRPGPVEVDEAEPRRQILPPPAEGEAREGSDAGVGEELLESALRSIHPGELICAVTRRPTVYRGNPFLIEVALSYGVEGSADEPISVYRYANRVPLQYQQGACAITRAVTGVDWKKYGLQHPRGALPIGSMVLLVHIASVWVPFTSESKEAVAQYPEIVKEIRLALQDCGRKLGTYINRRRREADEAKKLSYIEKYIPQVAAALQQILDHSDTQRDATVSKLTDVLERSRKP